MISLRALSARYLPEAYQRLFTDDFTLRDNPVEKRDSRRDTRRKDRTLLLLFSLALPVVALWLFIWLLNWRSNLYPKAMRHGIPAVVGGSYGALIFEMFTALHVFFVLHAVHRRTYYFFLQEYRQNTLQSLLCSRINPFQLILQASVYPFRQAMFIALAGLPLYAYAWSIGGASLADILKLYFFFAMASFRPPRWSVPVLAGLSADDIQKKLRSGKPKTWGEFWLANSFWILMIGGWYLAWAFGRGWVGKVLYPLWQSVPKEIATILAPFPLTWVVCLVRFLWTPLPYFTFALPPIAVIVPLYLLARLLAVWESSIHLRTGDTDVGTQFWDLVPYWRLRRVYGIALPALLLGYFWNIYVRSGLTSVLLFVRGAAGERAALGFLWLAMCLAALVTWARVREAAIYGVGSFREAGTESGTEGGTAAESAAQHQARRLELRYVLSPLVTITLLSMAACLLGGANPLSPPALSLIGSTIVVTLTGALLVRALPAHKLIYYAALFGPMLGWLLPQPHLARIVSSASPLTGLLSFSEHTARILGEIPLAMPAVPSWLVCALVTGLLGAVGAYWKSRSRPLDEAATALHPTMATPFGGTFSGGALASSVPSLPPVHSAPAPAAAPAVTTTVEPLVAPPKPPRFLSRKDTPLALAFIARVQEWFDNAVATREMRVLFRGHLGKDELIIFGCLMVGAPGLLLYRADMTVDMLSAPASLFFGRGVPGIAAIFAGLITVATIALGLAFALSSTMVCGTAFTREKDKSTLGFILVSPMPTAAIARGKLFGMLTPALLACAVSWAWFLVLAIPVLPMIGPLRTLVGLGMCGIILVGVSLLGGVFGIAWSTVFRKEPDCQGMALLCTIASLAGISIATGVWYGTSWAPAILPEGTAVVVWVVLLMLTTTAAVTLGLAFTGWRLSSARRGDVAFESSKK